MAKSKKSFVTLGRLLIWVAAALVIAAFFICFGASMSFVKTAGMVTVKNQFVGLIIGPQKSITGEVVKEISKDNTVHAAVSLIAIIVALVCAVLLVVVSIFKLNKKVAKLITILISFVFVVAGILLFFTKDFYISSYVQKFGGNLEDYKEIVKDYKIDASVIIPAIMMIVAGVVGAGSQCVDAKK